MGQGQSQVTQPLLVQVASWGRDGFPNPKPNKVGETPFPWSSPKVIDNAWHYKSKVHSMIINGQHTKNTYGYEGISVIEKIEGDRRTIQISPQGPPSKRANTAMGQQSLKRGRDEVQGFKFIFDWKKQRWMTTESLVSREPKHNKHSEVFYVGGSLCIADVRDNGLYLMEFEQGNKIHIPYPKVEKDGFRMLNFVGVDDKGFLHFSLDDRLHSRFAFTLDLPPGYSRFIDSKRPITETIDSLRDNPEFEHAMKLERIHGGERDNFVRLAGDTVGCHDVLLSENERVDIAEWLVGELKLEPSSSKILRNIYPTDAGHCVTNKVLDELNSLEWKKWTTLLKRVGVIPNKNSTFDFSKVWGNGSLNESETSFRKFYDSAFCAENDCKTKLLDKIRLHESLDKEHIQLLANMFVAINSYNIVELIKFALAGPQGDTARFFRPHSFEQFAKTWGRHMTLQKRTHLIQNMQEVLKNGRTGDHGSDFTAKVVSDCFDADADRIWTLRFDPQWGFAKSISGSCAEIEESKDVFETLRLITSEFRYAQLAKTIAANENWEKILGGVIISDGGKELSNLIRRLLYSRRSQDMSDLGKRISDYLLQNQVMGEDTRNALKEMMKIPFLDTPASEVLAKIGGPEPPVENSDKNQHVKLKLTIKDAGDGSGSELMDVAFRSDGKRVATASKHLRIWDTDTGKCLKNLDKAFDSDRYRSVAYNPVSDQIASTGLYGSIRIWNTVTGKVDKEPQERIRTSYGNDGTMTGSSVRYSPDGKRIVVGFARGGTVKIYDISGWRGRLVQDMSHSRNSISSVDFSPDGKRVVAGSTTSKDDMYEIRIWDAETGKTLQKLKDGSKSVNSVRYSPDGKRIVSGSGDKSVRIWDAETGECLRTLQGHLGIVHSVDYSPDGKLIVSGSRDEDVRIWDAETGECLHTIDCGSIVESVAFSPDGKHIASASMDHALRIWSL